MAPLCLAWFLMLLDACGSSGAGGQTNDAASTTSSGGQTTAGGAPGNGGATGSNLGGRGGQIASGSGGATVSASAGGGAGGQAGRASGGSNATGGQSLAGEGGGIATGGRGTASSGQGGLATGGAGTGGVATGGRTGGGLGGASATGGGTTGRDGGVATMTGGAPGNGGATGTAATCCRQFGAPSKAGQIAVSGLTELSGIVASRAHPGVLYAHADSGAGAVFYAMSVAGASLGTFTLAGAGTTDWEDIAVGPGPSPGTFVYVGDIGDNAARTGSGNARDEIRIYRVSEPEVEVTAPVGPQTLSAWQRLRFTYPDKAHDAETLLVDPASGDLLIVTKETSGASQVFRAAGATPTDTPTVLELVATLSLGSSGAQSALVSAGDISPSGDSIILRTYTAIWLWCRGSTWATTFGAAPVELPSASEPQSEGLTFSADGKSWYSAGETSTTIYQGISICSS